MSTVEISNVSYIYPHADNTEAVFAGDVETPLEERNYVAALSDINLRFIPGSLTLLVGTSGSGKSTLLRTCNGLIPKFYEGELTGSIKVNGHDIKDDQLHDAGRTSAMVFQNPRTQFFTTYVDTELAFAMENYGYEPAKIQSRINQVAAETRIQHLLHRKLDTLSGGELQRVACACALVTDVLVLLFDEPTSNLDVDSIADFVDVLQQLKNAGKTLIIAEHRLSPFNEIADEVYRIADGEISEHLSGKEFYALSEPEREDRNLRQLQQLKLKEYPEPSTAEPALKIKDLTFSYRSDNPVLSQLNLVFPAGKVTAITGRNGIGKTTLARIICGLERPDKGGVITYNGEIWRARRRQKHCALVMQDVRRQLFSASVKDEVNLGLKNAIAETELQTLLRKLDLDDYLDRHPLSLSGGQAQRLVVATAVAANCEVVIFDEPTSGVDAKHLKVIAELLDELANQGRVVIVITHDGELIEACADHVYRFNDAAAATSPQKGIHNV